MRLRAAQKLPRTFALRISNALCIQRCTGPENKPRSVILALHSCLDSSDPKVTNDTSGEEERELIRW